MKILVLVVILLLLLFLTPATVSYSAVEVEVIKPTIKEYAEKRVLEVFGGGWVEFERIIAKESRWEVIGHHYPVSNKSSAWGLCGTLVRTHKVEEGFKTDPYKQIDWCIDYTKKRYGNPQKALTFHLQNNYW